MLGPSGRCIVSSFLLILPRDDFKQDKTRILLKIDDSIKAESPISCGDGSTRGRKCGRAPLSITDAAAMTYQTDAHIATATAVKLKMLSWRLVSCEAQRINPEDAQVSELLRLIAADPTPKTQEAQT